MDKVIVTGGGGVLGAYVCEAVSERGLEPVIVDLRRPEGFQRQMTEGMPIEQADILDPAVVEDVLGRHKPIGVVHCAALLPRQMSDDMPFAVRVNCDGVSNILRAAEVTGCRRVLVLSTKGVYGRMPPEHAHPQYQPVNEELSARPESMYERTKYVAEGIVAWYHTERGLSAAALRTATQWGAGKMVARHDRNLHSRVLEEARAGERVVVPQGGDQETDMIYYPDLAAGIVAAVVADRLNYTVYNISTGKRRPFSDYVHAVRSAVPGATIELGGGLDFMGSGKNHYCVLDPSRASRDFAWHPRFDYESGVADYIDRLERYERWRATTSIA